MLLRTDTEYAPWNVVEAVDKRFAAAKIYSIVAKSLKEKVKTARAQRKAAEDGGDASVFPKRAGDMDDRRMGESILSKADLSLSYTKEEYKERLGRLQKKMEKLHGELYRRRIPVVLGFEGWDAGGKGGAIKRLTEKMDPRGYVVHPTASPNDIERQHHYLWRFWTDMPKAGHVTIFDRTWYGRVMVERIEGFCTEQEWKRAYKEINSMERDLADAGAVVLKFWMQIDKDEQERRFKARQENPEKQWKITDEDWRNREKWDQYEEAVNEMLIRTSTPYAPWVVVEGNSKYYARIKVLETVVKTIEERLKKD
jgi:polyphosphate kinase 2 (PPK2 family)